MEFFLILIIFLVFFFPLVFMIILPIYRKHHKTSGGLKNYNTSMNAFVYKVYLPKAEIIRTMMATKETDELACSFDFDRSIVLFSEYGSSGEYFFAIQECDGFCLLKLKQVSLLSKGLLPYQLNPFMVSKLNVEIVPFAEFGSGV